MRNPGCLEAFYVKWSKICLWRNITYLVRTNVYEEFWEEFWREKAVVSDRQRRCIAGGRGGMDLLAR